MTPAERIDAAIWRLERLKADSTQGEWTHVGYEGVAYSKRRLMAPGDSYRPMTRAEYLAPADADLIVTLHHTIDAQLTILRDFEERYAGRMPEDWVPKSPTAINTVALADAILGEST